MSRQSGHDRYDTVALIPQQTSGLDNVTSTSGTVLICDDRLEIREAIQGILADLPGFRVVGEAGDGPGCLADVERTRPDVLILDVSIPGGGANLAAAAKKIHPELHIIVFSGRHDRRTQRDMLTAGADQYVVKTGRSRLLVEALDRACPADRRVSV